LDKIKQKRRAAALGAAARLLDLII
jgi:hypothetical protein